MARLPAHMRRTQRPRGMSKEGGFTAVLRLQLQGLFAWKYEDPLLTSGTDGVGTELKLAVAAGIHHTVGIDLVAMSVNDLSAREQSRSASLTTWRCRTTSRRCLRQSIGGSPMAALPATVHWSGGETAILPDLYHRGDCDLTGFSVGVVERKRLIDGSQILRGSVAIGIASSGIHSNGYSLIRKVVLERAGLSLVDAVPECGGKTVGDPTAGATIWQTVKGGREQLLHARPWCAGGIRRIARHTCRGQWGSRLRSNQRFVARLATNVWFASNRISIGFLPAASIQHSLPLPLLLIIRSDRLMIAESPITDLSLRA